MAEPKEQEEFIDCTGRRRLFAFHTYRNGPILAIRATEVGKEFGYEFLVAGAPDNHPQLLAELRTKIREALARRHIIRSKSSRPGVPQWTMLTDQLEGRVTFDPDENDLCVVIDGEKVAWHEFKELFRTYEGFWFRLTFFSA